MMELQKTVQTMAADLKRPYLDAMTFAVTAFAYYGTGRPRDARGAFERAEAILRDQCIGVAYELGSARTLLFRCLVSLGELNALTLRAGASLHDAESRGDIYTAVNVRTSATSLLALARDDVAAAERELDLAGAHLSTHGFHVQHSYWLFARVQVSLYRGDVAAAEAAIDSRWRTIKRSLLLRVQNIRIFLHDSHARACVALLAAGSHGGAAKTAERLARELEGEGWVAATAQAAVVRGGLSFLAGDREGARAHLARAEEGFASLGMGLHTAVVQRRRGILLGGEEGRALVAASEEWMASQAIRNPTRMCALFAPGFPDSREAPSR
jgi:hypothetical protein